MSVIRAISTPPKDLQPAIDALGKRGKEYLSKIQDRKITHKDIAKAADYERSDSGES